MSEAFAALGDYSSSTTTMNASCFGGSCYGSARTTSYASNSGAANIEARRSGAAGVAQKRVQSRSGGPYMMDLTQKIDNYQYGYRPSSSGVVKRMYQKFKLSDPRTGGTMGQFRPKRR